MSDNKHDPSNLQSNSIQVKHEAISSLTNSAVNQVATEVLTLPRGQYKWNSNEDIYAILIATHRHADWLSHCVRSCPPNGSLILYDRGKHGFNYRRDGYVWKKRKDGRHPREDHMKLRVKGADQVLNGYYAHSAILSSFHRRSYSLPCRPNIILVHYLNAPPGDAAAEIPLPSLKHCDRRVWSREDLSAQIIPMYAAPANPASLPRPSYNMPSEARLHQIIDQLLTNQTNEDGVAVTAQWVLSLNNNSAGYLQLQSNTGTTNNTFQIPNANLQFVLGPINPHTVVQAATQQAQLQPQLQQSVNIAAQHVTAPNNNNNMNTQHQTNNGSATTANQQYSICDNTTSSSHQHLQAVSSLHHQSSHYKREQNNNLKSTITTSNMSNMSNVRSNVFTGQHTQPKMLLPKLRADAQLLTTQPYTLPDHMTDHMMSKQISESTHSMPTYTYTHSNMAADTSMSAHEIPAAYGVTTKHESHLITTTPATQHANTNQQNITTSSSVGPGEMPSLQCASMSDIQTSRHDHANNLMLVSDDNLTSDTGYRHDPIIAYHNQHHIAASTHQSDMSADDTLLPRETTQRSLPMEISHNDQDDEAFDGCSGSSMPPPSEKPQSKNLPVSPCIAPSLEHLYEMTAEEISSALSPSMPSMSHDMTAAVADDGMPKECSPGNAGNLEQDLQLDDNFDLFAELNVSEDLESSVFNSSPVGGGDKVNLTALAPEWSYSDGGCKVLLVGPWRSIGSDYSCMFGDKSVGAELVQEGVLSCITPAHSAGVVEVTVAYSGDIISESCNFEYRDRNHRSHKSWFVCEESRLQMALVDRLEIIKCRLDILFPAPVLSDHMNLEQRVTAIVHNIQRYKWRSVDPLPQSSYKGLTLLHLAAALGYRVLLEALNAWKEMCSCDILNHEISTRSPDISGCTPMHWACALGRMETTLVLYYMDRLSLDEVNHDGMTPLSLARAFRNKHIVEMLVQQEHTILESKLDLGLGSAPSKYMSGGMASTPSTSSGVKLRRSASPIRRASPARHPPITRHNSTPNSSHMPHQLFYPGEQIHISYDTQSEADDDSIVDIEGVSDNESCSVIETSDSEPHNHRIRTLAEHIIAAIPDRIKSTASEDSCSVALMSYRERSSSRSSYSSTPSCAEDSGVCTPLTSDWVDEWNRSRLSSSPCYSGAPSIPPHYYTPTSPYYNPGVTQGPAVVGAVGGAYHSTSAASTTSYHTSSRSESPPPSAQILGEYFNAGEGVEYGLSQLTLSDTEQRKLYQAAQVIQTAFRQFKDKKQQQKEIEAAIIIQTYYRRFKEFTTLRHIQKQQAATRIQSQFRSYYAQKRFKKSRDAALLIQHHYRAYKEHEHFKRSRNAAVLIQQKFRTHYNRKKSGKQLAQDGSCPYRSDARRLVSCKCCTHLSWLLMLDSLKQSTHTSTTGLCHCASTLHSTHHYTSSSAGVPQTSVPTTHAGVPATHTGVPATHTGVPATHTELGCTKTSKTNATHKVTKMKGKLVSLIGS